MADSPDLIDSALRETDRLKAVLKKKSDKQIRSAEEQALLKATAFAWFRHHRSSLTAQFSDEELGGADQHYRLILESAERSSSRAVTLDRLRALRTDLVHLRSEAMLRPINTVNDQTSDAPPDFSPLISDTKMQAILKRRWGEIQACLTAPAPLAATVMMGGLLEGLLLARINRETKKAAIYTAKSAPRDKGGSTLPLSEWTLRNYIDVTHDMNWIRRSAKDVGEVLRDYRNYIHPQKELTHAVEVASPDAVLFWEITKMLTRQVLASC